MAKINTFILRAYFNADLNFYSTYIIGAQPDEIRDLHIRRQLRQEPCFNNNCFAYLLAFFFSPE